ncbi:AAA family ATPase [Novosphingopyxis sp.]|uniref:AAA family ATPase n=1 Tax=Novosphingopyxis sp. TaxID=2709690 RepID=UPI003B5A6D68
MDITEVQTLAEAIRRETAKAITGQADMIDLMLTALFARGHILLEGPPGTAKTLTARCFSVALGLDYGRIQFTPDLMPGDIIGSNIYNLQTGSFTQTKGPVFCDLLLADEINRTPPKTQAALLEAMQERSVTFDGETHQLSPRFTVIATQNPIEHQGVYPLPEAQLDRFLFKHVLAYPDEAEERSIVLAHGGGAASQGPADYGITAQADAAKLAEALDTVERVTMVDEVADYIVRLVRATRTSADIGIGASPRSGAMLARGARARAALEGRDYVIPDDVKTLAVPALRHRVTLSPTAQIDARDVETIVHELVEATEAPR